MTTGPLEAPADVGEAQPFLAQRRRPRAAPASAAAAQQRITRYWDERAPGYDANQRRQIEPGALHEAWRAVWRDALPAAPCDVLDLGTGTGQVACLLAGLGHRVTGTDLSQGMLELARAKARDLEPAPVFAVGDAIEPDVPAGSFDAVTARYLLWTLHAPQRALANWRRLLREGGRLAVVDGTWFPAGVHTPQAAADTPTQFQRSYGPGVVEQLPLAESATIDDTVAVIRAAGFGEVAVTPLRTIEALDHAQQADLEHTVRTQYVVTATA